MKKALFLFMILTSIMTINCTSTQPKITITSHCKNKLYEPNCVHKPNNARYLCTKAKVKKSLCKKWNLAYLYPKR